MNQPEKTTTGKEVKEIKGNHAMRTTQKGKSKERKPGEKPSH